ncbi:MAG: orotidine-5'-phosphate decarboxylase [Clostridiaceae bacterium]|nr:orotidine-5'-phosphate decarboxylase [Clostridiaceae bacterium]
MFIDRLIDEIKRKNNPTVVGLDPRIEYVPAFLKEKAFKDYGRSLKGASEAIFEFNKIIIDSVFDLVPALKLQSACYELYGSHGIDVLKRTIRYGREKGLIIICDGKRSDISSSAEAYSAAFLGRASIDEDVREPVFDADALTVNPFLGYDGIKPFIDDCKNYGKGIFILVKTSNKSSGQLQDLLTHQGKSVYEILAEHVNGWGKSLIGKYGYSSVGAVVGATYPNQAKILRDIMKNAYILVPGYGAQGGTARDVVHAFNCEGMGAIVNASRSIICAYTSDTWKDKFDETRFGEAARAEVARMRDDINRELGASKICR